MSNILITPQHLKKIQVGQEKLHAWEAAFPGKSPEDVLALIQELEKAAQAGGAQGETTKGNQ